jgi:hypothetical protein
MHRSYRATAPAADIALPWIVKRSKARDAEPWWPPSNESPQKIAKSAVSRTVDIIDYSQSYTLTVRRIVHIPSVRGIYGDQ